MRRVLLLTIVLVGAAPCVDTPFRCLTDSQCVRGNDRGVCENNHRCSFTDETCESGRRFGPYGTGETCVPPPPPCAIASVATGANFTCVLSNLGHVSCWGDNNSGQLGDNTINGRSTPKRIDSLSRITQLVAGATHACILDSDGNVSCWGDNTAMQLGDGTATSRPVPTRITMIDRVTALAAGGRHTCARRFDGSLYCWGRNDRGQLGDETTMNRMVPTKVPAFRNEVLDITAGDSHTCALLVGGTIACWGSNLRGAIGPGQEMMVKAPVRLDQLPSMNTVSAGDSHTCGITSDRSVLCWGFNSVGQVGDTSKPMVAEPTTVVEAADALSLDAGGNHTCAVLRDGHAQCWGSDASGQLGDGMKSDTGTATVPGPWRQVAAGNRHTCGLSMAGKVSCWGRASDGQLGDGAVLVWTAPDKPVMDLARPVASVTAGGSHSCALTPAGGVFCWGRGESGQLGNGKTISESIPVAVDLAGTAVQIAAGNEFTCARLDDGAVQCWGKGSRGQLGNLGVTDRSRPVVAMVPEKAVHLGVGFEHACAVGESGLVYCWGEGQGNRLGNGTSATNPHSRPAQVMNLSAPVTQVAAGTSHTCALALTADIYCWGTSNYGQASVGPHANPVPPTQVVGTGTLPDFKALVTGGDHTCALGGIDGSIWCWGRGDSGQLGFGTTAPLPQPVQVPNSRDFVALSAGTSHTCATTSTRAACWGSNRMGQLGVGDRNTRSGPTAVNLMRVTSIEAGDRHTCAAVSDGSVHCWGINQYGQLGNGALLERPDPFVITDLETSCP